MKFTFLIELDNLNDTLVIEEMTKKAPYNFDHRHQYNYGYDDRDEGIPLEDIQPRIKRILDSMRKQGGKAANMANKIARTDGTILDEFIDKLNDAVVSGQERGLSTEQIANAKSWHKMFSTLQDLYDESRDGQR